MSQDRVAPSVGLATTAWLALALLTAFVLLAQTGRGDAHRDLEPQLPTPSVWITPAP